jgi:hypothetical protein
MENIYKHLGLKTDPESFKVQYNHNNRFFLDEIRRQPTEAAFTNRVIRTSGFLVAFANHGPDYFVGNSGKAVPELKHWSDIAYLQWTDPAVVAAPGSGELKYVLRYAIENDATISIFNKILEQYRQAGKKVKDWEPKWTGVDFAADSKQAQALLGTPNGYGVAWLLIQHKDKKLLGHKTVEKVTLFYTDREKRLSQPSLLFHLKDV